MMDDNGYRNSPRLAAAGARAGWGPGLAAAAGGAMRAGGPAANGTGRGGAQGCCVAAVEAPKQTPEQTGKF